MLVFIVGGLGSVIAVKALHDLGVRHWILVASGFLFGLATLGWTYYRRYASMVVDLVGGVPRFRNAQYDQMFWRHNERRW